MVTVRFLSLKNDLTIKDNIQVFGDEKTVKFLNRAFNFINKEAMFYRNRRDVEYRARLYQIDSRITLLSRLYHELSKEYNKCRNIEVKNKLIDVQNELDKFYEKRKRIEKSFKNIISQDVHNVCENRKNLISFLKAVGFNYSKEFEESNRFSATDFEYSDNVMDLYQRINNILKIKSDKIKDEINKSKQTSLKLM